MEFYCIECEENGFKTPHVFNISDNTLDWDVVEVDPNRQMGAERTHQAEWEYTCPQCGAIVRATFTTWEYPEGCFNDAEADYSGIAPVNSGECIQHDVSFKDGPDD